LHFAWSVPIDQKKKFASWYLLISSTTVSLEAKLCQTYQRLSIITIYLARMKFSNVVITAVLVQAYQVSAFSIGKTHINSRNENYRKSLEPRAVIEELCMTSLAEVENTTKTPQILDFMEMNELPTDVDVDVITQLALSSDLDNLDGTKEEFVTQVEKVMTTWASTKTLAGAETIQQMIERLEEGNGNLVSSIMFDTVRGEICHLFDIF